MAPCLFCYKKLERYAPELDSIPKGGGNIQFILCHGSKFHTCSSVTQYESNICDDCVKKYMSRMVRTCELW